LKINAEKGKQMIPWQLFNYLEMEKEKKASFEQILRPPLGLRPKWLWLEQRRAEILQAICRYKEAGHNVPKKWLKELAQHEKTISNRYKVKNEEPKRQRRDRRQN
jgi:hypothetical protein